MEVRKHKKQFERNLGEMSLRRKWMLCLIISLIVAISLNYVQCEEDEKRSIEKENKSNADEKITSVKNVTEEEKQGEHKNEQAEKETNTRTLEKKEEPEKEEEEEEDEEEKAENADEVKDIQNDEKKDDTNRKKIEEQLLEMRSRIDEQERKKKEAKKKRKSKSKKGKKKNTQQKKEGFAGFQEDDNDIFVPEPDPTHYAFPHHPGYGPRPFEPKSAKGLSFDEIPKQLKIMYYNTTIDTFQEDFVKFIDYLQAIKFKFVGLVLPGHVPDLVYLAHVNDLDAILSAAVNLRDMPDINDYVRLMEFKDTSENGLIIRGMNRVLRCIPLFKRLDEAKANNPPITLEDLARLYSVEENNNSTMPNNDTSNDNEVSQNDAKNEGNVSNDRKNKDEEEKEKKQEKEHTGKEDDKVKQEL